ncbi:hypothetical protein [Brachybacterium alimentarium]|uniref:hypothetical protein n=1 Tax=Brachybacterium TaxID=43668 RepID=UPI0011C01DF5|nr:hypothetical protein [Brachybacterium alimentarium]
MTAGTRDLAAAASDVGVRARYQSKILTFEDSECWWWIGAISGNGHGRVWLGPGWVAIAHRLGWAIAHPGEEVPALIGHECDNPLCQRPAHWDDSSPGKNRAEWAARRHRIGSPLRDKRGARGRALAIRAALLAGEGPAGIAAEGLQATDRDQLPLW